LSKNNEKLCCSWELLGTCRTNQEQNKWSLRTWWGTQWNHMKQIENTKFQKTPSSPPLFPLNEKRTLFWCMLPHLIACQQFLSLHVFITSFGLGWWQGYQLWGHGNMVQPCFSGLSQTQLGRLVWSI
jgi:hypothetical protein